MRKLWNHSHSWRPSTIQISRCEKAIGEELETLRMAGTWHVRAGCLSLLHYALFCAENSSNMYRKIIDWPHHLHFPEKVHLSMEALDLMQQ